MLVDVFEPSEEHTDWDGHWQPLNSSWIDQFQEFVSERLEDNSSAEIGPMCPQKDYN